MKTETRQHQNNPLLSRLSLTPRVTQHFLPLALYLIGAIIFTWPLVLNLGDRVINTTSPDTWQHLWHLWWTKYSLLDLKALPFYTEMLYYPQRVDLLLDSLNVATGVWSIPLQLIFGLVTAYNLVILLSVTLAGYSAYLLAAYLCGNRLAAFVAGVIYAFCPLVSHWLNLGQLDLVPNFWFPLFVLCYLRVLRADERWLWSAAGAVGCFVAMSLTSWYFTYFGLIFSGLALLYHLIFRPNPPNPLPYKGRGSILLPILARGVGTVAAAGLLLSPILLRTLSTVGGEQNIGRQTNYNFWLNSAALTDFIKPGQSAIWSIFGTRVDRDFQWLFLGFLALGLAVFGLITNFKKVWFWGLIGLVYFELSLGPTLRLFVKDESVATAADAENGLPLPNRLLYALPFGDIARIPLVSVLIMALAVGILAAFGLTRLQQIKRVARFGLALPAIAAVFIFLEFLPLPRTLESTAYPQFYKDIQAARENFAVIDLPESSDSYAMYYQTIHQKPMVGGYTARKPAYSFAITPGIKEIRSDYPSTRPRDVFDAATFENTPAVLNFNNIQYVVYHRNLQYLISPEYQKAHLEYLNGVFKDTKPMYEDKDLLVWRVSDLPGATTACGAKALLPGRMGGWYERAFDDKGEVYRWTDGNAEVNFYNPTKQTLKIQLDSLAQSWQQPRKLQLWQDGKVVQEAQIETVPSKFQLTLTLQPGTNRVQFKTPEPPTPEGSQKRAIAFFPFKLSDATPPQCG